MFSIERWQEIFEALSKNKLRTFLTGLSVASGIFILVILLGFSKGIENGVRTQFEQDATNEISIWTNVTSKEYKGLNPGRRIQLTNESFDAVVNKYGDYLERKSPIYSLWGARVNYKNESGNYRVRGTNGDYQFIENADIGSGRFISAADIADSKTDHFLVMARVDDVVGRQRFEQEIANRLREGGVDAGPLRPRWSDDRKSQHREPLVLQRRQALPSPQALAGLAGIFYYGYCGPYRTAFCIRSNFRTTILGEAGACKTQYKQTGSTGYWRGACTTPY